MIKVKDYKGYTIYYENDIFQLFLDSERVAEAPTEKALTEKADRLIKQVFTPILAYDHNYRHGKITSYNPEGHYPEFWFSTDNKERGKISIYGSGNTGFALDTPDNKVIIDQILKMQETIKQIKKNIDTQERTLAYVTKEYLDKSIT